MLSSVTFVVLAALGSTSVQAALTITAPSLVACEIAAIPVSGGVAPYTVDVIPPATGESILQFAPQATDGDVFWSPVNQVSGLVVAFQVTDATGASVLSAEQEIQDGTTEACLDFGN